MKRSRLKKQSKQSISLIQRKLWGICRDIVRKRDGNVCVICGKKNLEGSGWHTGHFIASSVCGAFLRYDLRNLHSSCYNCNINCGGNGALYLIALENKFGRDFVNSIIKDKQISIKADILFYLEKIQEYEKVKNWSKSELLNYTRIYGNRNT